jgi:hypothetical protein
LYRSKAYARVEQTLERKLRKGKTTETCEKKELDRRRAGNASIYLYVHIEHGPQNGSDS